ncbi:MAG TPA: autotransporter-associated beta strand repeat-containing protein [Verrucomicrobiota bacterium]|nr:autotransporter-associated beta strand repeat-containing protein [Verrucomicrobiota bacterium]HQL79867.1 autotransporter-associated beta strand repeat-containing protein [Verrucomicrobiota bacterium]
MTEYPGFDYATGNDNTNAIVNCTLSINGFAAAGPAFNRGDFTVYAYSNALGADDATKGLFIGSVMQNGRTNFNPTYGTNCWQICQTATNAGNVFRFATCQTVGSLGAGVVIECNANVAAALFPYSNWLAGWAQSRPYTNGYPNNYLLGSPGMKNWSEGGAYTNVTDLYGVTGANGGEFIVDLRSFGVWNTNGILLVAGGKDENNFAQSQANADGTWNVFVHDIGKDSSGYEQDQWLFVYVARTNAAVVSGAFQSAADGSPYIALSSGPAVGVAHYPSATGGASVCPVFTITNLGTGRWALRMNTSNYTPTNGVLIVSPAGGVSRNVDNIVTYAALPDNSGWEIQSRDLPSGTLQNLGDSAGLADCCSFVFIPAGAPPPGATVTPTNTLHTSSTGGTATFAVVLRSPPYSDVTIPVSSSNTNEGTVNPSSLTFTKNNWSTPQTVTVTGQPGTNTAPRVAYEINLGPASSADLRYDGLAVSSVAALNFKGGVPGVVLSKTSVTTSQSGQADSFGISLTIPPAAQVVIDLSSSDLKQATVAPASVTFTPADYATPQLVTVTGVNDYIIHGDIPYTIFTAPAASDDPAYDGVDGADVLGINLGDFTTTSITKANNSTALNLSGSWVSGGPPGIGDTALVDSTLASSATASLGASMPWYGIRLVNPGGTLTIGATSGAMLTLGAGGIDMTAAAGQDLKINCLLAFGNPNAWDVAASSTLTVDGNINNCGHPLNVQGDGNTFITGTLSGGAGLTKQGAGSLVIANSGANDFSGVTTIAGGTVSITEDSALGAPPDSAVANQITLDGGKLQTAADMTFNPNRGITLGAAGGTLETIYALGVESLLSGAGTLTISGGGELWLSHTNPAFTGNVVISDETLVSTFGATRFAGVFCKAGTITITNATLFAESGNNGPFGNPGTLVAGQVVVQPGGYLDIGSGVVAHIPRVLVLAGGELTSRGTVNATYGSWNLERGVIVSGGTNTSVISAAGVAVNQSGGTVFNVGSGAASGIDLDVTGTIDYFPSTPDNGLIKSGPGVMRLAGANTYTGATTISNGVLRVDGATGAGALTVKSNGTLAGIGALAGTVTVQVGGCLAPGDDAIGTLTVNNTLTLAGRTVVELSKSGTILAEDQVVGISTLTYGGSLWVTNISDFQAIPLAPGDSFPLFSAATYTGTFTNVVVPVLPADMSWDANNLSLDGSITVVGSGAAPVITSQPRSLTVNSGSPAWFTAIAAGPRPLGYQWRKNGANIAGASSTTYTIPSTDADDVAGYSVMVTNAYGSVTSAVAPLALNAPAPPTTVTNGLMVYLNFDNNLDGQLGTTVDGTLYTGGATNGPRYKTGVIGSAASFANTGSSGQPSDWAVSLGSLEAIYSNSFSVGFWERSASGAGALLGNKNWATVTNIGWAISTADNKNVNWNAAGGTNRIVDLNPPFSDGDWHLVTVSFNRATNSVACYLDGVISRLSDISPSSLASLNAGAHTLIGGSGNGTYAGAGDIDDLAVWNRVVTPDEVAAIYAAGLIRKPLNYAVPNLAPVIVTNLPATISVSAGGAVTLSVTATGPGPFSYQWQFNGAAIAGATEATLVLAGLDASGIDSSSDGTYTVLVSNGYGGVRSSKAVLTVYSRAVTGQWDFRFGDLRATVGADLEYVGDTTNHTAFQLISLNGDAVPVMAFGGNTSSQGFTMWHGAMPNGGGQFVNQYTLILDVMFPTSSSGQWRALLQSDPFNHPGNDADFYVGGADASPAPNGIGAEGQYDGPLAANTWYRVAFAVDLTASAGQQLSKYVNGLLVGSQSLSGGVDGRFALGPAAQLFTSGLSEGATQPGYVSSIQFVNGCLSAAAIAALGSPSADKLPPGSAAIQITNLSLNASQVTLNWDGPAGRFQVQNSPAAAPSAWQPVGPLSSNHSLTLPASDEIGFYRVTQFPSEIQIGQLPYGEQCISSKEIIRAAGRQVQFFGLPGDLVLSPDGTTVYIKNHNNMWVVDAASWTLVQSLGYPASGASMHGIAVSPDGSHVYVTSSANQLYDWEVAGGMVSYSRTISLASGSDPCGLAISADGTKAYVCLSIKNKLAVVNLASGTVSQQISVGIAPWDVVLSPDGNTAYVSDWGGRHPTTGDLTMKSAGTPVVVDERGVHTSGVVSVVNLASGVETAQIATGLHPSDLVLSPDGNTLYVANANSDTVTVIDTQTKTVRETILVRLSSTLPFGSSSTLPFGSAPGGLALSKDGASLFVAAAGNNAVAVLELPNAQHTHSVVQGFIPTDWYPGAVVTDSNSIYVVNVKGLGTRYGQPNTLAYTATGYYLGTANCIPIPSAEALSKYSAQVNRNGRLSHMQQALRPPRAGQAPVPVPAHAGEPSVFQHVVYIVKENKTYDQIFGDMAQGNGNPSLCIYPQYFSPNHHALAQQYVLLDNFYCNGVNSAVGHNWCTEANDSDHLEKSFGGFVRSYGSSGDPLSYVPTGFIWNNVLEHGLTFRNYGEFASGIVPSGASWGDLYADYTNGTHSILFTNRIPLAPLVPYTSTNVPGWNLNIPDVVRAYGFIKELNAAQARGSWETFHFLWLPNDHTGGTPSARAQVADNDLSLGQVVEAITKSIFGSNTVIFVIEDDPQSGYDHVDGHRSICLVISPYTKRNQVISTFYNQAGVVHTMERIMGLPPMNQGDAMAPIMFECFTNTPDYTPYTALPNNIDLVSGDTAMLSSKARYYAKKVQKMDLSYADRINDDVFNRFIWHSIKGNARYPSEYVGGHGKGLKKLGLVLAKTQQDDDD